MEKKMENMLDDGIKEQVSNIFSEMKNDVDLVLFVGEEHHCEHCDSTKQLLSEITALSKKLTLRYYDIDEDNELADELSIDKIPAIVVIGKDEEGDVDYGIKYFGIPAGHEFSSLIQSILMVSSADSGLSEVSKQFLSSLDKEITLQVFVTPSCPYCPQAVILAHKLALESPFIQSSMVEAIEFPELSQKYGVSGVPHTLINEGVAAEIGAIPEEKLINTLKKLISN
jgi:glutaredoxin-like protein